MPPPSHNSSLHLLVLDGQFFIEQFPCTETLAQWVVDNLVTPTQFFSVTRTKEEISIVGRLEEDSPEEVRRLTPWTAIKIKGPMEHGLTGILADFTAPLKAARVPIFAISTWNTDYILVPYDRQAEAKEALTTDGWTFVS